MVLMIKVVDRPRVEGCRMELGRKHVVEIDRPFVKFIFFVRAMV